MIKTKWTLACDERGELCALEDQFITIEDGLIKQVSEKAPLDGSNLVDYGFAIAMPGLINLHCHLDYSKLSINDLPSCSGGLGSDSKSILFAWIPALIAKTSSWSESDYFASALHGASLAAKAGTSFVVDNSFQAITGLSALAHLRLKGLVGLELFGVDPEQANNQFAIWQDRFEKARLGIANLSDSIDLTVSPHAPYTVSPQLWRLAADFAMERNTKVLAHVAESSLERDWFANENLDENQEIDRFLTQAFTRFRNQDGIVEQVTKMVRSLEWRGSGHSPVEHLKRHSLLDSNLIATHCVVANDEDIESMRRNSTSIALCPVSNFLLANGRAPIEKFFSSNLKMGLGTDSLASSYSLDLREQARFILENQNERHKDNRLTSKQLLSLLTIKAACALGKNKYLGSIETGKSADILILKLPKDLGAYTNVFDMALSRDALVEDLFVDGNKVVSKGDLVQVEAL